MVFINETIDDLFSFSKQFGLPERLWGVDYQRSIEYSWAINMLGGLKTDSILDIGVGKHSILPFYLAHFFDADVEGIDIRPSSIDVQTKRLQRCKLSPSVHFSLGDITKLSYESESFDVVTSVSSIEHVEDERPALQEIKRVLRPGGYFIITVPFSPAGHVDQFRNKPSYKGGVKGESTFFEHEYSLHSLMERIVNPSALDLKRTEYFGEPGFSYRNFFLSLPFRNALKYGCGWLNKGLSKRFMGEVSSDDAQIAGLVLQKPVVSSYQGVLGGSSN